MRDYLLIILVGCLLFVPGLGAHGLWDVDEAHNAECAREMMVAGNWIVPTFNFTLRTDKPALLYWCMGLAYAWFGVTEFAARLPSALASVGSLLLTYGLGRRMFDQRTGLLAALVLGTCIYFGVAAHSATPDALLIFCVLSTFFVFWHFHQRSSNQWLIWIGVTTGLAMLAKGVVGVILPVGIIGLFLIWQRQLRVLWTWRLPLGLFILIGLATPWYLYVGVDTKWEFWRGFFLKHHVTRFQSPLEGHSGSFLYHPLVALATFAPWSIFLMLTIWYGTGRRGRVDVVNTPGDCVASYRFLWCWLVAWFVIFSFAGTKLPNYVLPAFPALALLTGRLLARWHAGQLTFARAWWGLAMGLLATIGVGMAGAALIASGYGPLPLAGRTFPNVVLLAPLGLILIASAWLTYRAAVAQQGALERLFVGVGVFVASMGGIGPWLVDDAKASRPLCSFVRERQVEREVRLGCYEFYQPSLVYYGQRKVERFANRADAIDWLKSATQVFLFLPADEWVNLQHEAPATCAVLGQHGDVYSGRDVVVVTNKTIGEDVSVAFRSAKGPPSREVDHAAAP